MSHQATKDVACGFSLLEVIAVLAVTAILAGALAPSLISGIDEGYSIAEEESLETLANAFTEYLQSNKRIPSPNQADWGNAIGMSANLPPDLVTRNQRGHQRALYFDPRFFTNSDSDFTGFTQLQGLMNAPISPRLMIVSNLKGTVPVAPNTGVAFQDVWTQAPGALLIEDKAIKIKRINLAAFFHRVVLTNANTEVASYNLEDGDLSSIPAAAAADGSVTRYLIDATRLSLHAAPYPTGELQTTLIVQSDLSYHYRLAGAHWVWGKP